MPIKPFQWTCPFCDNHQIVTSQNWHGVFFHLDIGDTVFGELGLGANATRCTNPDCNEVSLATALTKADYNGRTDRWDRREDIQTWRLLPDSLAKPQPGYIPAPLVEDYIEACHIRDKSPKAAATLARRCLQGMIRDFSGIAKKRLIDEIKELEKLVDAGNAPKGVSAETIAAIDAVRSIGNIGAHMEMDINLIIDVDPGEAQSLIELIEMLFDEWYIARHKREERLAAVLKIAAEKKAVIAAGQTQPAQPSAEVEGP